MDRGQSKDRDGSRTLHPRWVAVGLLLGLLTASPRPCRGSEPDLDGSPFPPPVLPQTRLMLVQPSAKPIRASLSFEALPDTDKDTPKADTQSQRGSADTKDSDDKTPAPAPVVPPPTQEYPLDLMTALSLAGVENPTIALAEEAVRASLAEQLRAQALLLPSLDAGGSFDLHRGRLQSARGILRDVNRQSLYAGDGAFAVGAGTVRIPGVWLTAQLAEAVFEPRAAGQQVVASRFDALATRNNILLDVTTRYFALMGAETRVQVLRESESDLSRVVQATANFAKTGQGRESDAQRARSTALLLHSQEQGAEGEVAVAAANLAQLLNMDPAVRLRPADCPVPLVPLVDPHADLEQLIQIALSNRPEIAAATATIGVVATHLREEEVRPWVPLLSVGYSAGEFGGGSEQADTHFGHFRGRTDFDVLAVWSFHNFGLGNLATVHRRQAEVMEAEAERARVMARIRREVADAYALTSARYREYELAARRVETATRAFREDLKRTRNLEGRPIEVLNSLNLLSAARQDLIRTLIGYNQAEFQLFVALGQPPTLVPSLEKGTPATALPVTPSTGTPSDP